MQKILLIYIYIYIIMVIYFGKCRVPNTFHINRNLHAGIAPGCSDSTCLYGIQYGDQSFSVGFFAQETLTLTPTDVRQLPLRLRREQQRPLRRLSRAARPCPQPTLLRPTKRTQVRPLLLLLPPLNLQLHRPPHLRERQRRSFERPQFHALVEELQRHVVLRPRHHGNKR